MANEIENKIILERKYIVPLRKGWLKVPEYKRSNKAVKTLKEFIARHMKVYDRDLRKIKIDIDLNNEIRFRGMRKPPAKIGVIVKKFDDGNVTVELLEIPEVVSFKRARKEKMKKLEEKKITEEKKKEVVEENKDLEKKSELETKEREETSKDAEMNIAKQKAKEQKHVYKEKKVQTFRKALSK